MLSGIMQFLYCALVTNFPFNAFLAGYVVMPIIVLLSMSSLMLDSFGSCVGQFVLTASLRSQVNPVNRSEFKDISPERCAFSAHSTVIRNSIGNAQSVRRLCPGVHCTSFLRIQLLGMSERARRARGRRGRDHVCALYRCKRIISQMTG